MFMVHGVLWLAIKSEGDLHERACRIAGGLWPALAVVTVAFLVYSAFDTNLFANYLANPVLFVICLAAVGGLFMARHYIRSRKLVKAWTSSAVFIATVALFGVVGIYPNLLPSRIDPAYSMTIANSSSSHLTLTIMLCVALTFVPIVIVYQAWVYRLFRHKVTEEELAYEDAY
jgi:cytochrome d ubiquinol oxidase subunit II